MRAHYELFDHTADIGVRVFARSLTGLLVPATAGFYAVIGHLATCGHPAERQLELTGDDSSLLLRDYLTELLHLFESERRQLTNLVVREFTPEHLSVVGQARLIDRAESVFEREVKAVTYHELAIRPVAGGYEATYIVDI
jgi:SHS2 domain-containing protein